MAWLKEFADMEWTTSEMVVLFVIAVVIGITIQMVWSAMDDMKQNDEYGG